MEWDAEALARLRAAAHRGDGDTGVLRGRPLEPVLQYAGDVLLAALARNGADEAPARACVDGLKARGLPGDAELAAALTAALDGSGDPLDPLPVDLGAVAAALDDGGHVLDLERGDVLPGDEELMEIPGRWLPIPPGVLPEGEDARRGAARQWLAAQGYRPVPRTL
ncbi:hypothetical protein HUT06_36690 [Actinomadura sp. NAK00032]|uniref:hypothetical protein n=1 Tax=Actinomadura sp. NAK00032 TaxID=2742128 RepID=UPI0015913FEB|nr:hypothetical protein [Actinomadura sp. NAK00032]QKW38884.1 hypothetical protein HUT06_36690 [Actinomadura sp. NAK00032]